MVTEPDAGAPGAAAGDTGGDAALGPDIPTAFVAVTVNLYGWPLVKPVTSQVNAPAVVHDLPPGLEMTVYPVTRAPPSVAGASQETATLPTPGTPDTPVGAPGTVPGVTATAALGAPAPAAFTARNRT